jgi:hypothetical protein
MRRSFRYDPLSATFVEIDRERVSDAPAVRDDITPFVSPIDGTVVASRSALREHMGKHDVVPFDEVKGNAPVADRYAAERERRAFREQLWEHTDRALRTGKARG